jgi:hypothetical protein
VNGMRVAVGLVVLALGGIGCTSRVPLSKELRDGITPEEFQKLQCYVSHDIVLRRTLTSEERDVTAGNILKIEKDKRIEEVVIPAYTPGVVVSGKDDRLMVSFEPPVDGKERFLVFTLTHKWDKRTYYFFPDGEKDTVLDVTYGGKPYTCRKESLWAFLMIDESVGSRRSKETREVSGRRVGDGGPK